MIKSLFGRPAAYWIRPALLVRLRMWALRKLAGKATVMINLEMKGHIAPVKRQLLAYNCRLDGGGDGTAFVFYDDSAGWSWVDRCTVENYSVGLYAGKEKT